MDKNSEQVIQQGLTESEVLKSRLEHGENILTPPKRGSLWRLYLESYKDPIIKILLIAVCLSFIVSYFNNSYIETVGILAAVLLATTLSFFFEYDARRKFDILNSVNDETEVKVVREGKVKLVLRKEVVVGDVVILEQGEEVPADGTLFQAFSLQLDESSLTGELLTAKSIDSALFDKESTYPSNQVMKGTLVVDGHGAYVVSKIGDETEIGRVAQQSSIDSEVQTPLNLQLTRLAKFIGTVGFVIAITTFVIFTIRDLYHYFQINTLSNWSEALQVFQILLKHFMVAVTLLVVAVPEGLPMSVTLSLALNMKRMLRTNNLVRKMHASETIGAITTICTDKTGTLTENKMTVNNFVPAHCDKELEAEWMANIFMNMSINSTAYLSKEQGGEVEGIGNPTEIALLKWLQAQGESYDELRSKVEIVEQLTFSTERKYMGTRVRDKDTGKEYIYIKGAPEVVLSSCDLADHYLNSLKDELTLHQAKAMRTLAFAFKSIPQGVEFNLKEIANTKKFNFLGYVAITDPVRPDVPASVKSCLLAGIDVKIVTGDTFMTAREIARQIGLWGEDTPESASITGPEFAALSDADASKIAPGLRIMSRARPTDKQRLVQLLQAQGEVVAVTGDGTNDAPALNFAHVGLSMGSGTSVAKEASDITLLDDSFHSISTAVMWGRSLYRNIQRFIVFQLTVNFVALFVVLLGGIIGDVLPLTITQMLWVNLIMDSFAALALASIPPSMEVMKNKPRKSSDFIITKVMGYTIVGVGLLFLVALICLLNYFRGEVGGLSVYRLTYFFSFFVMLQIWNLLNMRVLGSNESVFKGLFKSTTFLAVILSIFIGQYIIVTYGGEVFRTVPLEFKDWIELVGLSSVILWLGEFIRWIRRLKQKDKDENSRN